MVLEMPAETTQPLKKWGKNRTHFFHAYFNFGFAGSLTAREGLSNNILGSGEFDLGFRYKLKLNNTFSLTSDLFFGGAFYSFDVAEDQRQILYTDVFSSIDRENWDNGRIALSQGLRINFGKRGNHIGKYVEAGVFGTANTRSWYRYQGKSLDDQNIELIVRKGERIRSVDLLGQDNEFYDRGGIYNYGFYARMGINRYVLYSRYTIAGDFQLLTVGFELGLF